MTTSRKRHEEIVKSLEALRHNSAETAEALRSWGNAISALQEKLNALRRDVTRDE